MAGSGPIDGVRLSKTMAFLLRHRPEVGDLCPDGEGWVEFDALVAALTRLLRMQVTNEVVLTALGEDIRLLSTGDVAALGGARFEVLGARIRAVDRPPGHAHPRVIPPDILYHPSRVEDLRVARANGLGAVDDPRRPVSLLDDEASAWRVAHRVAGPGTPAVIVADAARARRRGFRFYRDRRTGLFLASHIPPHDLLNLLPGFEEQLSAGGIPVRMGADRRPQFALIRVTRRSGVTWEVAKGKLEHGETPEAAAIREVREEMGIDAPLAIRAEVARVRYGFLAPGGLPRLKSVYLYLMMIGDGQGTFRPAEREGIGAVRWFSPEEAVRVVTHSSLLPAMRRARQIAEDW
jgi:RNA:NAD 2'-phosphotransferase (TPT1/KptA family)/8-oxo-dGTP pyrophosphatase MutT (NUDIX family)